MRPVVAAALAIAAAAVFTACGTARDVDQSTTSAESCMRCHGLPPATGAHQAHLNPRFSPAVTCATCHVVPLTPDHADRQVEVVLSALAQQGVTNPGYAGGGGSCATYCHGSTAQLGNNTSPPWTSTSDLTCGGCHSATPDSGFHELHRNPYAPYGPVACTACHPGYAPPVPETVTHLNGTFEASPITTDVTFTAWPTSCTPCHPGGAPPP